ncbi:hypothetical protein [Neobacillus niacini]|uniref:hypothetical protein n=1 Tax=Neobacillus niacini TaxID=86668 RepID=UPI002FFE163B
MKKIITLLLLAFILTACAGEKDSKKVETIDFTIEEFEKRITDELTKMGDSTKLKILSSKVNDEGRHVIQLSDRIMIFVDLNDKKKVTAVALGAMADQAETNLDELMNAFRLFIKSVDNTLSDDEASTIVKKLGLDGGNLLDHTEVHKKNNIEYTYKGSTENNIGLKAIVK